MIRSLALILFLITGPARAAAPAAGLFETNIDRALAVAKRTHKPLLIDFYGIWCPPCNQLEEEVFETPAFQTKAKAFQLLKVDADAETSWKIKNRYKVGGYPTIIFADPQGGELYRLVGYRTPAEFLRAMDIALAAKGRGLSKACQSADADDLWRCALICSERKDKPCAEKAYKSLETKLKPGSVRYEEARTYSAENAANDDLKRLAFERLLAEFPQSPGALVWATEYLALGIFEPAGAPAPKKELVQKALDQYAKMAADPRLDEMGLEVTDLLELRAELLDKLGKKDESKAVWKEAADKLQARQARLPKDSPARGFVLERIGCLDAAGHADEASALAAEYSAKYPEEFTFYYARAGILERGKKYGDAIPLARKAYQYSYGDNRIRVATLLIKLLATVPDPDGAKKIYDEVTQGTRPASSLEVRTHRYLKQLDEAYKTQAKKAG